MRACKWRGHGMLPVFGERKKPPVPPPPLPGRAHQRWRRWALGCGEPSRDCRTTETTNAATAVTGPRTSATKNYDAIPAGVVVEAHIMPVTSSTCWLRPNRQTKYTQKEGCVRSTLHGDRNAFYGRGADAHSCKVGPLLGSPAFFLCCI